MKLIVGGHHLWRDAALIREVLDKCQMSTDETLRIVPASGRCGTLARRVANKEGYHVIDPPKLPKGASVDALNKALVDAHDDAALMLVFHDRFFHRGLKGTINSKLTRNLTDKAIAADMGIILVTHQHGTVELN